MQKLKILNKVLVLNFSLIQMYHKPKNIKYFFLIFLKDYSYPKSGNPGYIFGKPLLLGYASSGYDNGMAINRPKVVKDKFFFMLFYKSMVFL